MQRITRCTHCGELLGTRAALSIHNPGNCRSERTMLRAGCWRGYAGIWWSIDRGFDGDVTGQNSESLGLPVAPSQAVENKGRKLGQNGGGAPRYQNRDLSKFRKVLS